MATILNLYSPSHPQQVSCILLCIPWAGGNGAYFRQWISYFKDTSIQLCAVNLPGRGKDKSNAFKTIQAAAENISSKLELQFQNHPNIPMVVFGHSLGN